jgi:ABC-2 type transport system ATP-binding protein
MSIVAEGVTKLYGRQKALDNVSFTINTGEIVGFLGPNGAGKSTMMKIITGFIPASSGRVLVNGLNVEDDNLGVRKKIGYLPENNPLYPEMYVREYLAFVASVYKTGKASGPLVDNIIEVTGLAPEQKKTIGSLSKGYRQRVGLAQALIHNPPVLILDEATTGLDPNQIHEIRNLIREAGREKTVMLSTHIMQEVEAICDRVIIIDKGVIMADRKKDEIYSILKSNLQTIIVEFGSTIPGSSFSGLSPVSSAIPLKGNTWKIEGTGSDDLRAAIFSWAVGNNITILSLQKQESNLEEVFRHLTSGEN